MFKEEIKFRGSKFSSNEFVYGNLIQSKQSNPIICAINNNSVFMPQGTITGWAFTVKSDSVSRYIGLRDKNGTELYLYDAVKFDYCEQKDVIGMISLNKWGHSMILVDDKEYHIENAVKGVRIGVFELRSDGKKSMN